MTNSSGKPELKVDPASIPNPYIVAEGTGKVDVHLVSGETDNLDGDYTVYMDGTVSLQTEKVRAIYPGSSIQKVKIL